MAPHPCQPQTPQPLRCPEAPLPRPSWLERICWLVPVLGWIVAGALWSSRREPTFDFIAGQLRLRDPPPEDAWGPDPVRRSVARVVSDALQAEFLWPNAYFTPEDPLRLLLWRTSADQEWLFVVIAIERRLDIRFTTGAVDLERGTLGDLVDAIVTTARERPPRLG